MSLDIDERQCNSCLKTLPVDNFYTRNDGYFRSSCISCERKRSNEYRLQNLEKRKVYMRQWWQENKDTRKAYSLKYSYNLTVEEYDAIWAAQGMSCAICKTQETPAKGWCVDHDHDTNKVRGILCTHCNLMLGHARDNQDSLLAAIEYLKKNEAK